MVKSLLSHECKKAFTLIELLLSLIITGMALSAVVMSFSNYLKGQKTQEVSLGGISDDPIPVAPAWSQMKSAMDMQLDFREDLLNASSVFVLGGKYESGGGIEGPPTTNILSTAVGGISSLSFLENLPGKSIDSAVQLRDYLDNSYAFPACDVQDFTVIMLGHPNQENTTSVLSIATVRSWLGSGYRVYTVEYYRNTGGALALSNRYEFAIEEQGQIGYDLGQQDFKVKVGAEHYWGHEYSTWGISEELGCKVVFPDPTALPRKASNAVNTFTRFVYFLPVKQ